MSGALAAQTIAPLSSLCHHNDDDDADYYDYYYIAIQWIGLCIVQRQLKRSWRTAIARYQSKTLERQKSYEFHLFSKKTDRQTQTDAHCEATVTKMERKSPHAWFSLCWTQTRCMQIYNGIIVIEIAIHGIAYTLRFRSSWRAQCFNEKTIDFANLLRV